MPVYTSARHDHGAKLLSTAGLRQAFAYRRQAGVSGPRSGLWVPRTAVSHWPSVGEIDVMEQWNPTPGTDTVDALTIHGAVHGPKAPGSSDGYIDLTGTYTFPGTPSGGLHQFAVEWGPGQVDFYVDGYLYESQSVATLTGREVWEQDRQPFNLLLNLCDGGRLFRVSRCYHRANADNGRGLCARVPARPRRVARDLEQL